MKYRIILSVVGLFIILSASAKEGMWIPTLLKAVEGDMQSMGLELTAEDIYSVNNSSLKDAIALFGGGCTAEIISDKGLLLTNHHCGYGQIQRHSSLENDYLKDGFWAMTMADELANPGLTATFIVRIEDVTDAMSKGITDSMSAEEISTLRRELAKKLEEAAVKGSGHEAQVKPFNYGNSYFMIVTKTYEDVRLVGAPPSSVGKFGGDTDNWMWPRHTGDFSIFRIYAGEDNEPAEYNEANKPYSPPHHLPISMDGVQEGDFTMVFGFPGRTEQYLPAVAVDYVINKANPMRIKMRETSLAIIDAAMMESDLTRIQYAAKQSRISNAYKKWIGQNGGLIELRALEKKREQEKRMSEHNRENGPLITKINEVWAKGEPYKFERDLFIEYYFVGPEIMRFSKSFLDVAKDYENLKEQGKLQQELDKLRSLAEGHFKDYNRGVDKKVFASLTSLYLQFRTGKVQSAQLDMIGSKFKGDTDAFTGYFFGKSAFDELESTLAVIDGMSAKSLKKLMKDPAIALTSELYEGYLLDVRPMYVESDDAFSAMMKDFVIAMEAAIPERVYWADANSTLRLTYGKAEGSAPRDGMEYKFCSTAKGILQKYIPEHRDFDLPPRLVELLEMEDYGDYATEGELRVCFTGSNHTTGGNSGSPALNGKGYLVGLNFDRSWESTMSDIMFDASRCRNIMVDIKYVLFIVDKYAGAKHLIDEMTLVRAQKEEPEMDVAPEEMFD